MDLSSILETVSIIFKYISQALKNGDDIVQIPVSELTINRTAEDALKEDHEEISGLF